MFRILTVCTGNIARSPLAEKLLEKTLPAADVEVASAGTHAHSGTEVPKEQLKWGERLGAEGLENHRPQRVNAELVEAADLVLGMDRGHRKRLVRMAPAASRKVFTIREFAHLAPHVTPEEAARHIQAAENPLVGAVRAVAAKRGTVPPAKKEDLDVVDPFGRSGLTYRRSARELAPAVEVVSAYLNGILRLYEANSLERPAS